MNKVENVRIRDPGGRCDGALARLVVGRARIRVEGDHTRREGKRGPICLLFSEAGRWYLYGAESNAREQVRYESSEQKGEKAQRNVELLSPGTDPHGNEGKMSK